MKIHILHLTLRANRPSSSSFCLSTASLSLCFSSDQVHSWDCWMLSVTAAASTDEVAEEKFRSNSKWRTRGGGEHMPTVCTIYTNHIVMGIWIIRPVWTCVSIRSHCNVNYTEDAVWCLCLHTSQRRLDLYRGVIRAKGVSLHSCLLRQYTG